MRERKREKEKERERKETERKREVKKWTEREREERQTKRERERRERDRQRLENRKVMSYTVDKEVFLLQDDLVLQTLASLNGVTHHLRHRVNAEITQWHA